MNATHHQGDPVNLPTAYTTAAETLFNRVVASRFAPTREAGRLAIVEAWADFTGTPDVYDVPNPFGAALVSLAEVSTESDTHTPGVWRITVSDRTGGVIDNPDAELTDPAEAGVLAALRVMTSCRNGDLDTARAVINAVDERGMDVCGPMTLAISEMAAATMVDQLRESGGLNPTGLAALAVREAAEAQ